MTAKRQAKGADKPRRGRPKMFKPRQQYLVSLYPESVAWLDQRADESGTSRNEVLMMGLYLLRWLWQEGHLQMSSDGFLQYGDIGFRVRYGDLADSQERGQAKTADGLKTAKRPAKRERRRP